MKSVVHWHSQRLSEDLCLVRWGHYGRPVLILPTAGGDAEEIERFQLIDSLRGLIEPGRIKVYSCDSVAGRIMVEKNGAAEYQMAAQNAFHQAIYHEVVPAIRQDCQDSGIEIIIAGSSIGAFHALSCLCRFPDVFRAALGVSGTYDIERFFSRSMSEELFFASPLHFLPGLAGPSLETLQARFALLVSGQGKAEDIGESWRAADALGAKGVPNRVDAWGHEWDHDWPTWRIMYPKYLEELSQ